MNVICHFSVRDSKLATQIIELVVHISILFTHGVDTKDPSRMEYEKISYIEWSKVSVHLMITVKNMQKKMAITEYIQSVDRATMKTVNTVQLVSKCLETGEGHFEHYL
jgi:hypothetical protein